MFDSFIRIDFFEIRILFNCRNEVLEPIFDIYIRVSTYYLCYLITKNTLI